jgi:hypothetical protein
MISGMLLAVCLWGADGSEGVQAPAGEATPLYVLSRQTSAAMKREALAQESAERAAAIRELCELHRTLRSDPRYDQVDTLQDLRGRVYSRLRRVQLDLKKELARASEGSKPAKAVAPRSPQAIAEQAESDEASLAAADSLALSMQLVDSAVGGPSALVGSGGGAVADNGQALVDLIERTINPTFWDTVGGPGSIMYYQPLQCLVVRASGEVHAKIGGALGGLRAAGR